MNGRIVDGHGLDNPGQYQLIEKSVLPFGRVRSTAFLVQVEFPVVFLPVPFVIER